MKKLFIIGFVFAGFALASCTKQQITPVSEDASDVPVWEKALNDEDGDDGETTKPIDGEEGTDITDPNNDPDGNKK